MKLAVLGCGNMGSAIIDGVLSAYGSDWSITAYDPYISVREKFSGKVEESSPEDWFREYSAPDIVLLAVKPQVMQKVLSLFENSDGQTLWVSIAAGITLDSLQFFLPENAKICRVMPNTPAMIGEGMSGFSLSENCEEIDQQKASDLLSAIGKFVSIPESMINAITGVSGSGPAYVYTIIEALTEGGVVAGLPYPVALKAATQTLIGAAKMVEETGLAPAVLRSQVMSPGGTTAAGVKALEDGGLRSALMNGVVKATARADELGA